MQKPIWPNYNIGKSRLGLERIEILLEKLGNPHRKLPPVFHIAGTNGKGSTSSFLKYILQEEEYVVHRYTSPHLADFNERIEVAGKPIEDNELNQISLEVKNIVKKYKLDISFFEAITAMAFLAFSRSYADAVILEVGLGGRLDATNVIKKPLMSIITPISYDHTSILGKTLSKIAAEKAGIIKKDVPIVISKQKNSAKKVFDRFINKKYTYGEDWNIKGDFFVSDNISFDLSNLGLAGKHQYLNAGCAIEAILKQNEIIVSSSSIQKGIEKAFWAGRLQDISDSKLAYNMKNCELWLDCAHNEGGAKVLNEWIVSENNKKTKQTILICGMLNRKDFGEFISHLKNIDGLIGIDIAGEKTISQNEMERECKKLTIPFDFKRNYKYGISFAKKKYAKNKNTRFIICGSIYLIGKIIKDLNNTLEAQTHFKK